MSQIIRILSHGDHLIALTDDGKLFQSSSISHPCWREMRLPAGCEPVPPRFSLPEEYEPPVTFTKPPARRPTSIGSDGNYIPPLGD